MIIKRLKFALLAALYGYLAQLLGTFIQLIIILNIRCCDPKFGDFWGNVFIFGAASAVAFLPMVVVVFFYALIFMKQSEWQFRQTKQFCLLQLLFGMIFAPIPTGLIVWLVVDVFSMSRFGILLPVGINMMVGGIMIPYWVFKKA